MDYYEGKLNHLWVDLFILDKLPEGKLASEMTRFIHKAIYGLAMGHRHDLDYSRYSLLLQNFCRRTCHSRKADSPKVDHFHAEMGCLKRQKEQRKPVVLQ